MNPVKSSDTRTPRAVASPLPLASCGEFDLPAAGQPPPFARAVLAYSLWISLCALCLTSGVALAQQAPAVGEGIQIFQPLNANQEVYLATDDGLLIVPGGRMFMFQVEISAMEPLLEVRINGRLYSTPQTTWTFIKLPHFLHPGKNRIFVEARTRTGRVRRGFVIELRGLPGFQKSSPAPAS